MSAEYKNSSEAAAVGDLLYIKRVLDNGEKLHKNTLYEAAKNGHLEIIKFIYTSSNVTYDEKWWCCFEAATSGHLDCLKYCSIAFNSSSRYSHIAQYTAAQGHLSCLKYICESCGANNLDYLVILYAAHSGQMDCLIYLIQIGAPVETEKKSNWCEIGKLPTYFTKQLNAISDDQLQFFIDFYNKHHEKFVESKLEAYIQEQKEKIYYAYALQEESQHILPDIIKHCLLGYF